RTRAARRFRISAAIAAVAIAAAGLLAATPAAADETVTPVTPSTTPFDDTYFVMQHNTYDYGASMTSWLDQGLRAVEVDLIDRGDWEDDPNGPYVSHDGSPFNANCSGTDDRLGNCLTDIANWQAAHPGSGPIEVFIDMKASWDPLNAWNDDEVSDLDQQVHSMLGSRMYTADQLYQFAAGTSYAGGTGLRNAVATAGWPTLAAIGDRIVVDYTGGKVGLVNQTQGNGIDYEMSHTGHLPYGFFCPDVEADPDQLNPGGTVDGMSAATSAQIVCSNMDSQDHYEITADRAAQYNQLMHLWGDHVFGNESYVFNYIAIAHGVTAIGRDATSASDTFGGTLPLEGVRGSVPGYFELQASDNASACVDSRSSGTSNGTAVQRYACNGSAAQRFVYTAEGQLRPRYDNPLCVDIDGGSAKAGKAVHLWDCDGGSSEKWVIAADGSFRSFDNTAYCLTMPSGSGTQLTVQSCNGSAAQRFALTAVPSWVPTAF
ncbi:MAG TPA: Ca2+-dependent phosphoinositide-specific phospholipase C, partial [Gryllotalpicola sp.]